MRTTGNGNSLSMSQALALALVVMLAGVGWGQPSGGAGKAVRVCAVSQSWAAQDRTLQHVLGVLAQAAAQRAQIVCLPQECVPTDGGPQAQAALDALSKAAAAHQFYLAANLKERDGEKRFLTSYLLGPDGKLIGKYRKSHRLPDEDIALGDALPVFDTPLGKIGLMIGSDQCWPEVPLVLALDGAELILWSHGPEPVPQEYPLEILARARALDDHVTLVASNYAGDLPYLCSNWPNYTGSPLGRGFVVDRSGVIVADTGIRPGVACAELDLKRGKDIYFLTFKEDRSLFHYLVEPNLKPLVHKGPKRKIKVSVVQVAFAHGPNPDPQSEFAKMLDEAGRAGPDVILMAEFGYATDTPQAATTFALVAEKARKYKSYIIIGGLRDPENPYKDGGRASWAYLWDREGKIVGKYRISQYGSSTSLPVFKTDFGVIGLMLCGDIYSQEIARSLALQGAEIILCGSQSWGPSGRYNLWLQQARAVDNALYMATAHFPFSDIAQRSYVIDPYGFILAGSAYACDSVATAEVDLDAGRVWFARSDTPGAAGRPGYLSAYYPKTIPDKRDDWRAVLFAQRRPELYRSIVEKTLAERRIPDELMDRMNRPRQER